MFFWMPLLNTSLSTSLSLWVSLSVSLNSFSRPGERVVIADLAGVEQYAEWLRDAGCTRVQVTKAAGTFPPQKLLTASK